MNKTFRRSSFILLLAIVGFADTTFSQTPPVHVDSADSTCTLIPTDVITKTQGAEFVTATSSVHDDGRFKTANCYYKLQPEYQSVSLEVISHSKTGVGSPAELWRARFRREVKETEADGGVEAHRKEEGRAEESAEAEHRKAPEHLDGVGDDAYWVDTGRDGALYVLNGERIIRLSLGGRTPQVDKKARAIEMANSMLKEKNSGD